MKSGYFGVAAATVGGVLAPHADNVPATRSTTAISRARFIAMGSAGEAHGAARRLRSRPSRRGLHAAPPWHGDTRARSSRDPLRWPRRIRASPDAYPFPAP